VASGDIKRAEERREKAKAITHRQERLCYDKKDEVVETKRMAGAQEVN